MSHWSKGKVKIKDLLTLDMVAKKKGLTIHKAQKGDTIRMHSTYAGEVDCERIYSHNHGEVGVYRQADGSYTTIMDNYHNPIVQKIGPSASYLMREYSTEIVHAQAMSMGGVIASQEILKDGSVEVEIQI